MEYCADDDDELDTPEGPDEAAKATSTAWRVGGLSKWVVSRLLSTLIGILTGVMILITLY